MGRRPVKICAAFGRCLNTPGDTLFPVLVVCAKSVVLMRSPKLEPRQNGNLFVQLWIETATGVIPGSSDPHLALNARMVVCFHRPQHNRRHLRA